MSTLNMHPPQTYSRLFRPWDCNSRPETGKTPDGNEPAHQRPLVKREYNSSNEDMSTSSTSLIKAENLSFSGNESDRECASSSSSSTKSYDESFNNSLQMERSSSPSTKAAPSSHAIRQPLNYPTASNTHLYGPLEGHMHHNAAMPMMAPSASDLYYAAAAAAGLPNVAATNSSPAAAAAAAAYALDPYALSLMEQEYARVMAEEAHLKAVNARKQRPKKFKCPHCDVAFSNNGQLKGHIRIHTGERPFKCDVETCGKTFTRNEELTRHKRIHTGLRPYPCSACGKKFGRRDHLKKHMKTHMPQERQLGPAIFVPMYPYLYGY
ncbi:zinc finger protein 697 [Stomoxys calcitrans]|uniref:zinc finger protein 697 n=1 Tax=Stomoxys calcitrans TaxID=35570 RepID=UPI0027E24F37|nr:zinc finger protein 697 [Stomoxys calcitrans]